MPSILFATNFLAGSLLSILLPVGLLIAIAVWYVRAVQHVPEDTPTSSAALPAPEVVAAATSTDSEDTPVEPPGDF